MVDIEYNARKDNKRKRLIKRAAFDQPQANIHDINYTSGRKLNKSFIERLSTCEYIQDKHNIIITGACNKALSYTPHPSYKSVKNILVTGQDKISTSTDVPATPQSENNAYGYTRGAEYYGGKNQ